MFSLAIISWFFELGNPNIFKWNFGYSFFSARLPAYHLAEVIGFEGLSAIVIIANVVSFKIWVHRRQKFQMCKWFGLGVALLVVMNFVGWGLFQRLQPPDKKVNVLIVQSNIGNLDKVKARSDSMARQKTLNQYIELTLLEVRRGRVPIDFILWPETAFPSYLGQNFDKNPYAQQLFQTFRELKIPLITGSYGKDLKSQKTSNSIFFIDERGHYVGRPYSKSHLLLFGEYIPMGESFPILYKWLPQVGNFFRGDGPLVQEFKGIRLGSQICYESLFPRFSIALANQGAQMIVNVTNDSWYGTWQEPYQHLYEGLARAVEVRRPIVRSTNTGISTVVLASGEMLESSRPDETWAHTFEVPYASNPPTTIYQRWPWLFPFVMFFGLLVSLWLTYKKINMLLTQEGHLGS